MEKILLEKAESSFVEAYSLLVDWDRKRISLSEKGVILFFQIVYEWLNKLPIMYENESYPDIKQDYHDYEVLLEAYMENFVFYFAENREKLTAYIQKKKISGMSPKDEVAVDLFVKEVVRGAN